MKEHLQNSLQRELANSKPPGSHPDADLLTAFAEGTLTTRERENLFAHLATCTQCREVVSIGAASAPVPALEVVPRNPHPVRLPLRAWLPWVAATAGILVVSSAVVLQRSWKTPEQQPNAITAKVDSVPPPAEQKTVEDTSKAILDHRKTDKIIPTDHGRGEASERSNSFAGRSGMRETTTSPMAAVRPHWRIDEDGQVQRSFGQADWQTLLTEETARFHVISVVGSQVWAGGENLHLYRSDDNGTNWKSVALPAKNSGAQTIVRIHFDAGQTGRIETENGTVWTTSDAGLTWK